MKENQLEALELVRKEIKFNIAEANESRSEKYDPIMAMINPNLFADLLFEMREKDPKIDPFTPGVIVDGVAVFPVTYLTTIIKGIHEVRLFPCHAECLLDQMKEYVKEQEDHPF